MSRYRVHYIEYLGAGTPVVLIHGLPGAAQDWEDVTPLLAGRRTIAVDRTALSCRCLLGSTRVDARRRFRRDIRGARS